MNLCSGRLKLLRSVLVTVVVASVVEMAAANAAAFDQNLVTAIQDVAKKAIPCVVHVEVTEKQSVVNPLLPFRNDPFFQYFFGSPGRMPRTFERIVTGLGSGILMDPKGHILTNSHVVNGTAKMTVVLSDGRKYSDRSVRVIGVDPKTDVAVIEIISRENFPYADFGDSDKVDVGQWVVAIGHPRGLDQTVTQGIISAKHRRGITDPSSYQDFLQTDAAINPGNSGGPLLNLNGEVIGVNAAIVSESGGFEGIGFATPINMALRVAKQLISGGRVKRGYLGLTIRNLTPELANSFGAGDAKGVLVANVLKDGPSERAGIRRGDIIVACDGKPVDDPDTFRNELAAVPIGQSVALTVLRDGLSRNVGITISSDREQGKALLFSVTDRFGVEVRPMEKKDAKRYGLGGANGVVVSRIDANGAFDRAGIESGDIILQIDRENLAGTDQFGEVLSTAPPGTKLILTVVDHRTRNVGLVQLAAP
ncbi:MAG TPA: Do family serine endopeptidase [Syntrophobacteraceae bacterium]|nr:Do family serine endopeptidase [Syntrophobacteraceae bacterium]